jgi:hypothetical protein
MPRLASIMHIVDMAFILEFSTISEVSFQNSFTDEAIDRIL